MYRRIITYVFEYEHITNGRGRKDSLLCILLLLYRRVLSVVKSEKIKKTKIRIGLPYVNYDRT